MFKHTMAVALMVAAGVTALSAQAKKPAGTKGVTYDVTINADGAAYTGKMVLAVTAAKVTGTIHITQPSEITGKVAGTAKGGEMSLDFPYHMVQRKCDGQIAMNFKLNPKATSNGTVAIVGCDSNKLTGTIELKPEAAQKKQ